MIVADEIASRAGAFGLARTLRDAAEPYTGVIVILLERKHDAWLAKWSGADAWFVKPVDPFELADRLLELVDREGERVKIKGTCKRDGREFFAEQVDRPRAESARGTVSRSTPTTRSRSWSRCARRNGSGRALERALERVADLHPAFTLDEESVLGELQNQLGRLHRNLVRQG